MLEQIRRLARPLETFGEAESQDLSRLGTSLPSAGAFRRMTCGFVDPGQQSYVSWLPIVTNSALIEPASVPIPAMTPNAIIKASNA